MFNCSHHKKMAKLYRISSILMAALFVVSASVQFNDRGWYLWIALYVCAAYVNLVCCWSRLPLRGAYIIGHVALCQAHFFLSRVFADDEFGGFAGIWSLNMRKRVVREKLGSVLVILSMILQVSTIESFERDQEKRKKMEIALSTENGMAMLVGISYGLSIFFLVYHGKEMKF